MIKKDIEPLTFTQKPFFVKYSDSIDAQDCCLNQGIQRKSHFIANNTYLPLTKPTVADEGQT